MPNWINEWWTSMSERSRNIAMVLIVVCVIAFLVAGVIGYRFQLLPGILGQ